MIEHLKNVKKVLDGNCVPFWLEHGSLLGAVRDGRIIEGDDDIDLASFFETVTGNIKRISAEFYNMGYGLEWPKAYPGHCITSHIYSTNRIV